MKESIRISILASLFMFLFLFSAPDRVSGQQKDKSYYENQVISAVEKYDSNDFEGASDILEEVIAGDPENDAAHYYMGLSAFCRKDFVSAERELKTAVQLDSMNFWYRYRLALVYSATDRKELTIAMYEKLLKDFHLYHKRYHLSVPYNVLHYNILRYSAPYPLHSMETQRRLHHFYSKVFQIMRDAKFLRSLTLFFPRIISPAAVQ